jgi:MFS family permease
MVGYRALEEGADPVFLGLLAASFALPALLLALTTGKVADRFGGTIISLCGLLTAGTGTILILTITGLPVLLAASAVIGLGHLMVMVGQQTFVAHASAGRSSDSAFGTLTAAASIGQLIGPPAVTLAASVALSTGTMTNTSLGLLVCLGFSTLATPAYAFLRRKDASLRKPKSRTSAERVTALDTLRAPGLWRSLVVSGAILVTVDLMYAFVPVWAQEHDVSAVAVGLLLALRAAVSVLSRLGLTRLLAKFGRKTMLMASTGAAILSLITLPLVGPYGAIAVMIGLGLGLGIPQPLTMAWVISQSAPSRHGAVLGLRMTVNRFAQITLPIIVGSLAAPLGVIGIFWANAALLLGAVAVVAGSTTGNATDEGPN